MEAFETLIERIAPNLYAYRDRFFTSFAATFEMFGKAGLIAFVVGLFFGVLLVVTRKGGVRENLLVYQVVNIVINVFRSIPFIILLIFLIPLTRAVVGSAIGVKGAILPLVFGTVPFYTRQVEVALAGVNEGKVEAARSMDVDFVSGGERRDFFFSMPVARRLGLGHLSIFKDLSCVYTDADGASMPADQAGLSGKRSVHIADLVTVASSYIRAWIPAVEALGAKIALSLIHI